jgi:hypothetical protein
MTGAILLLIFLVGVIIGVALTIGVALYFSVPVE